MDGADGARLKGKQKAQAEAHFFRGHYSWG
jgi:hypothetical protein